MCKSSNLQLIFFFLFDYLDKSKIMTILHPEKQQLIIFLY